MSNAVRNWKDRHLIIQIFHTQFTAVIIVIILVAIMSNLACSKEKLYSNTVNDNKTTFNIYSTANLKNNPILFHTFVGHDESYLYSTNAGGSNLTKLNDFSVYGLRICETNPIILMLADKEYHSNICRMAGNGELIFLSDKEKGGQNIGECNPLSPGKNKIVFKTYDNETSCCQICLMDYDGSNKITALDNLTTDIDASWSPNGQYLAVQNDEKSYVIDVNTTNIRNFPNGYYIAWSPDNKTLLFKTTRTNNITDNAKGDLYIYDVETMKSSRISGGDYIRPQWLDSKHIAVIKNNTICVIDKNGDNLRPITQINNIEDFNLYWAPDSKACLVDNRKYQRGGPTKSKLQLITFDSTWSIKESKELGEYEGVEDIYWAPNSQKVIFVSETGENRFINCLEIDRTVIKTSAIDGPYFAGVITKPWSKDSSLFVFARGYLYVYDTINNTVTQITNTTGHCCPTFIY